MREGRQEAGGSSQENPLCGRLGQEYVGCRAQCLGIGPIGSCWLNQSECLGSHFPFLGQTIFSLQPCSLAGVSSLRKKDLIPRTQTTTGTCWDRDASQQSLLQPDPVQGYSHQQPWLQGEDKVRAGLASQTLPVGAQC